jgi:DNA-binding NarL/FixJ family response regulator
LGVGNEWLKIQECLREISPRTQIIFVSARDEAAVREAALEAGALAFLVKPFEDNVLLQLVESVVAAAT